MPKGVYTREYQSRAQRLFNNSVPVPETGCWLWLGYVMENGYPKMSTRDTGRSECHLAHRVSYEEFVGPIPEGMVIDHRCRETTCVNPAHLEAVTQSVNVRRGRRHKAVA